MNEQDFTLPKSKTTLEKLLSLEFIDLEDSDIFTSIDAKEIKEYLSHLCNFQTKNYHVEIGKLLFLLFDKPLNGFEQGGCLADSLGLGSLESFCADLNVNQISNHRAFYRLIGQVYYAELKNISKKDKELFFSLPLSKLRSIISIVDEDNFHHIFSIAVTKTAAELHSIREWYMNNHEKLGKNCLLEFIKVDINHKSLEQAFSKNENKKDFVFERLCFYPEQAEVFKLAIDKCSKISNSKIKSQLIYLIMIDFVMTTSTTSISNANKTLYFTRLCEIMGLEACIVEKSTNRTIMNTLFHEEITKENE